MDFWGGDDRILYDLKTDAETCDITNGSALRVSCRAHIPGGGGVLATNKEQY